MILIGSFPTGNLDWSLIVDAINQGIDSRLMAVKFTTKDISDKGDEILGQKRIELSVDDTDSLSVLLYRLYESNVDAANVLFQDLCMVFLDTEDCWVELINCQSCVWPNIRLDGVPFGQLNLFVSERVGQ